MTAEETRLHLKEVECNAQTLLNSAEALFDRLSSKARELAELLVESTREMLSMHKKYSTFENSFDSAETIKSTAECINEIVDTKRFNELHIIADACIECCNEVLRYKNTL